MRHDLGHARQHLQAGADPRTGGRDFFLVVVSGIEGAHARPKVRVIIDPLHQLRMTETSSVSFAGVRSAEHGLVYDPVPLSDSSDDA